MVGAAAAILSPRRGAALLAVVAALVAWNAGAGVVPGVGEWSDILIAALVLVPLTLAVPWLALPVRSMRATTTLSLLFVGLAFVCDLAGLDALFNVAKLLALTTIGFLFMAVFEALSWIVLVAVLIPWVDALSVWRGPTDYVVSEQPGLFERVSIAFRLPGDDGSAHVGPPDILFFALFLSTTDRFGLRVRATWLTMVGLLALTLILTATFDVDGLPALPAIAFGFLLPNADLLWRAWRERGLEIRG